MDIIIDLCSGSSFPRPPPNSQPVREPLLAWWMDPELEGGGTKKNSTPFVSSDSWWGFPFSPTHPFSWKALKELKYN